MVILETEVFIVYILIYIVHIAKYNTTVSSHDVDIFFKSYVLCGDLVKVLDGTQASLLLQY